MSDFNTAAGTSIYIGTTATDAETDTYVEVGKVSSVPEFGRVYTSVKFNPLKNRGTGKVKGSYDDGTIDVLMAKDSGDAGQKAILAALGTDFNYNFKIVANDAVPAKSSTVTITIASPGEVTWTAHGLTIDTAVKFTTDGTLPSGIIAGTTYYVKTVVDVDTFTISATKGGSVINTTSTQSGVHTGTTVPAPTEQFFKAQVLSYTTNYGTGPDNVVMSKSTLDIQSGSLVENAKLPAA